MVSLITPTSISCQDEQDIIDDNLISGIVKELKLTEQQPIPKEYNSLFGQIKVKVSKGVKENKWGDYIKNFFKTNKIQDEFIEPVTTLLNEAVLSGENEWNHYEIFEKDKNVDNAHYYTMFISIEVKNWMFYSTICSFLIMEIMMCLVLKKENVLMEELLNMKRQLNLKQVQMIKTLKTLLNL